MAKARKAAKPSIEAEPHDHPHEHEHDNQEIPPAFDGVSDDELKGFIQSIRAPYLAEIDRLSKTNQLLFLMGKQIAAILDGGPVEREDVNLGEILKRVKLLTQCGVVETLPPVFGEQSRETGPCVKRQGHRELGDRLHEDETGLGWCLNTTYTVKQDSQEVTYG